ncbi:MAG: isoprenylcysteine carboxylmethyltransferase family protein [Acidobacteria bacterium]|nr:isoprenylcysteine carboxylmethyltransferase family protein [Acidobacteriota bacterium]
MTAVQRIRVPAGMAFALIFLYFSRPRMDLFLVGLGLALAGLGIRIWAAGHIDKGSRLAACGPYRFTRNPLYLGSFLIGLGFSLAAAKAWLVVLFLILFFALYVPVMRREERELEHSFGSEYESYRRQVPFFLPRFSVGNPTEDSTPETATRNFQWRLAILNREHHAVVGFVMITVVLWGKMLWI